MMTGSCSLVFMSMLMFIFAATAGAVPDEIAFGIKLVSVGVDSALFELTDDNVTAVNYAIRYRLSAEPSGTGNGGESGSVDNQMPIRMLTNPLALVDKDAEEKKTLGDNDFYYDDADAYGEKFPGERAADVRRKTYAEVHRFSVGELEPNVNYVITFTVEARLAHLQRKIVTGSDTTTATPSSSSSSSAPTLRSIAISFKTLFDVAAAAQAACEEFLKAQAAPEPSAELYDNEDYFSSCYAEKSNCTECKAGCYQLAAPVASSASSTGGGKAGPILCEPCPCDTTKSTGECTMIDQRQYRVRCKQCLEPYTGLQCNECKNEGIDYYKNELGECMRCDCNGNSAYDVHGGGSNGGGSKLLKCQAGTGICIDCQFNTTGRHCHECRGGFVVDPIRRTCIPRQTINMSINIDKAKQNRQNQYLNEKYSYKSLLLLAAYIFVILSLILTAYFVIRMKYRHHVVLKHGPHESCLVNTVYMISECFSNMYESTRPHRARLAFHITWLCPSLVNRLRSARSGGCSGAGNGGGGSGGLGNLTGFSSLNEDDRLNLAENQVFDDMGDDPFRVGGGGGVNPFEDVVVESSSKNPYSSLTSSRA